MNAMRKSVEARMDKAFRDALYGEFPAPEPEPLTFDSVNEAAKRARYGDAYVPPMFKPLYRGPFIGDISA